MNYTQEAAMKDIERYAEDENAIGKDIYDFGVGREWLTQDVIDFASSKGITITTSNLKVEFIKRKEQR